MLEAESSGAEPAETAIAEERTPGSAAEVADWLVSGEWVEAA